MHKTLIIGAGYLGKRLIAHYMQSGTVDVITRSHNQRDALLKMGCGHFARDITNSKFTFPMGDYQRVVLNAAVTVDSKHNQARHRLYVNGTQNVVNQLILQKFRGRFQIVGSTSAIPDLSAFPAFSATDLKIGETEFEKLIPPQPTHSFEQYQIWKSVAIQPEFTSQLVLSAGIYGPDRIPGAKILKGLRKTGKAPNQWINFIHIEDLCRALIFLDENCHSSDFFFISDGVPVTAKDLYDCVSSHFNLPKVEFNATTSEKNENLSTGYRGKKIENGKIISMGCSPIHPSVLEGIQQMAKDLVHYE